MWYQFSNTLIKEQRFCCLIKATSHPKIWGMVPEIRHTSQANIIPIFFHFFPNFYYIFFLIFFRMETLILFATCPIRTATVLHTEQKSVKMYVRYKNHNGKLCIIVIVISLLFVSPNTPSRKWSPHILSTTMGLSQAPLCLLGR